MYLVSGLEPSSGPGREEALDPRLSVAPLLVSHHSNQPATMPRKKGAAWEEPSSGNGTARAGPRRRGGPAGRKRERPERCSSSSGGGSSGDEDGPELDGAPGGGKRTARPATAGKVSGAAAIITEPEHTKERVKLEGSKCKGQLLIFGATNWDLIGRKEVPKQQAAYRNLGQNLWGPHRYGCLSGVRVRTVVSGSCAAHSLLITTEGKLWSWGRNEKGQLGHGDTKRVEAPRLIEALSHEAIVLAACGRNHTLALTDTGSVFAFGENKMGQLGLGNQTDAVPSPAQIMYNGQPITKMACGAEFSMLMDCKGNLYSFGCPEYGQLGHNSDGKFIARAQRIEYDCELVPRRVAIFIEKTKDGQILPVPNVVVRDVACGANHTLVLDSQKRVFSWGFGGYGRLGHAEQKDEMVPRLVKLFDFPGRGATQIYAGYTCSFAVSEVGAVFLGGYQYFSRVYHVPKSRAGPLWLADPEPCLREEQHHRSGRREYHQLGPITNLRGIGIWGPQAQVFYCSSGGEDSGWHLLRTGGHGLFTFIGDSTR